MKKEELIEKLSTAILRASNNSEYEHKYLFNSWVYGTNDHQHFERLNPITNAVEWTRVYKLEEVKDGE